MKSSKQRRGETGSDLIWSAKSIPSTRGLDWVLSTTISWAENSHRNTVTLTTEWRSPHLHSGCLLTNLLTGQQTTRSVSFLPSPSSIIPSIDRLIVICSFSPPPQTSVHIIRVRFYWTGGGGRHHSSSLRFNSIPGTHSLWFFIRRQTRGGLG